MTWLHLIRPAGLLLVPPALLLWWLWRRQSDPLRGWRSQIEPGLLAALTVGGGAGRRGLLLLAAWLTACVAIAGPTWRREPNPFADDATPLLIVLKADASMDAAEPPPSRLERAKLKIADLAQARRGQPLGLIAYAGSAHLVLPPTRDTAVVARMAADLASDVMPVPGDRLDLALAEARRVLAASKAGGSVLVIADGAQATALAADDALPVQCLAVTAEPDPGLRAAARALDAPLVALTPDDGDVQEIIARAAGTPVVVAGEGGRWQEAGWWLVPLLALAVLASFRRQEDAA